MIITRLAGGIGNQMFHYAAARGNQRSDSERIVLDAYLLRPLQADIEKISQRPFALDVFPNLAAAVAEPAITRLLHGSSLVDRIRRRFFRLRADLVRQEYLEPVNIRPRRSPHLWLLGNFQSEEYFSHVRHRLLEDFRFAPMDAANESIRARMLASPNALSIHLRRGDYQSSRNKGIYDSVTLDYYQAALHRLTRHVAIADTTAFVFSDDIAWARANFNPPGLTLEYIEGNDAADGWKDMSLMTCCRHHIIANSSFSWWGAWLGEREGEKFAPRHWFRPAAYPFDINHIAPRSWHVIDYDLR